LEKVRGKLIKSRRVVKFARNFGDRKRTAGESRGDSTTGLFVSSLAQHFNFLPPTTIDDINGPIVD